MAQETEVADALPRWHSPVLNWLGKAVLRLFGWHLEITLPNQPKFVIVSAPHTSNWDFVFGLAAALALGIRMHWLVKHSLFRWPLGGLMTWLGGVPVNRNAAHGIAGQIARTFASHEKFIITVTPEGTRKRVQRWKKGFYQIARAANVPIVLCYLDYERKVCGTGPLLWPTGDYAADLEKIQAFYRKITPRRPEHFLAMG